MALSFNVTPGYSFSASEKVTYPKLNLLGSPVIQLDGQASSAQIADGSITTAKLASTIDINSKIADHNIDLDKLASGTHGQILYYDANGDLVVLDPSSDGKFLKCQGPGADPKWESQAGVGTIAVDQISAGSDGQLLSTVGSDAAWVSGVGLLPSIATSGAVAYFDGSAWIALDLGENGYVLQSNGSIPVWDAAGSVSYSAKGRFACSGTATVAYTGDTNIASAVYAYASGPKTHTLTITYTNPVAVDLPVFIRLENSVGGVDISPVNTSSRTTSGIVLIYTEGTGLTNPFFNIMITT